MRKFVIVLGTFALLVVFIPIVCRKRIVPLISNGKIVATAKRPSRLPWKDNRFDVDVGKANVFSLWGDFFDYPMFIYPFADGQRFLCIDDDDTSVLVFIVELATSRTNDVAPPIWPPNEYTRTYLAQRAANVVMYAAGVVRLPDYQELQEVSNHLAGLTPSQFRRASFPALDLGLFRGYWPKETLLAALHPNRQSCWP